MKTFKEYVTEKSNFIDSNTKYGKLWKLAKKELRGFALSGAKQALVDMDAGHDEEESVIKYYRHLYKQSVKADAKRMASFFEKHMNIRPF